MEGCSAESTQEDAPVSQAQPEEIGQLCCFFFVQRLSSSVYVNLCSLASLICIEDSLIDQLILYVPLDDREKSSGRCCMAANE